MDRKVVIVTGAANGIGRAACERLAARGWAVLAVDRDEQRLGWTAGGTVVPLVADIASEEDNRHMVAEACSRFGRLDALVLNAGVTGGGGIEDLPMDDFRRVLDINLIGTVLGIRAALPALRMAGGAIAVTSSTMGLAGDTGNWAYCASKHALIGLVRAVAREVGWQGIRINALCPGLTRDTGMTAGMPSHVAPAVPLQRWADADEMAAVIEFLVSSDSSYVSGHALVADGGALVGTGLVPPGTLASSTMRVMEDNA